jgi:hypothetical protein
MIHEYELCLWTNNDQTWKFPEWSMFDDTGEDFNE